MADATLQILGLGTSAVPLEYTVPGGPSLILMAVKADFDGTGAGSDFVPVVEIVSTAGEVMASGVGPTIAAGGSASVTYAPFLGDAGGAIRYNTFNTGGWLSVVTTMTQGQTFTANGGGAFFFQTNVGTAAFGGAGDFDVQVNGGVGNEPDINFLGDEDFNLAVSRDINLNATHDNSRGHVGRDVNIRAHRNVNIRSDAAALNIGAYLEDAGGVRLNIPNVNPGAGSGYLWNNGGVISVA